MLHRRQRRLPVDAAQTAFHRSVPGLHIAQAPLPVTWTSAMALLQGGVRAGRDEVLARALRYLQTGR